MALKTKKYAGTEFEKGIGKGKANNKEKITTNRPLSIRVIFEPENVAYRGLINFSVLFKNFIKYLQQLRIKLGFKCLRNNF